MDDPFIHLVYSHTASRSCGLFQFRLIQFRYFPYFSFAIFLMKPVYYVSTMKHNRNSVVVENFI